MSIILNTWPAVDESSSQDGLTRDSYREYKYYFVQLDSPDPQLGGKVVLGSPDLPKKGDPFEIGSNLLCWTRKADIHDRNRFVWKITVEYASNEITAAILNGTLEPWGRAPLYDWSKIVHPRILVRDYNTDPTWSGGTQVQLDPDETFDPSSTAYRQVIQNSAKQLFADPVMHEVSNPLVRIRQAFQVEDWDYATIAQLQGTLNDDSVTIQGSETDPTVGVYQAGQCKLNSVVAVESLWISPLDGTQTRYYDSTIEIEIAAGAGQEDNTDEGDPANDFSLKVHNCGYHYRDGSRLIRCMVDYNVPGQASTQIASPTPLPLDPETGGLWTKKNDDGSPADIPLLTFFPFPYADWSPLGLNTADGEDDGGE